MLKIDCNIEHKAADNNTGDESEKESQHGQGNKEVMTEFKWIYID